MKELLFGQKFSREEMKKMREFYIYNNGNSGRIGAEYMIQRLVDREKARNVRGE